MKKIYEPQRSLGEGYPELGGSTTIQTLIFCVCLSKGLKKISVRTQSSFNLAWSWETELQTTLSFVNNNLFLCSFLE